MSALYITIKPIYPKIDGGCVAMASFLNHLINLHPKIDHLTVSTYKHPFDISEYNKVLNKKIDVYSVFINTKISVVNAFLNLFSTSSYNIDRFYNLNFENKLKELLKNNYEVIYIESIFLLPYLKTIRSSSNAKIILRAPNIEHKIWEKQIDLSENLFKKFYLKHLTKKLKRFENQHFELTDGILTISNHDANYIQELNIKTPVLNLPFAIKSDISENIKKNNFFFIGAYNWKPNSDAIMFLINELFPEILKKIPDAKLHIAGSYTPIDLYKFKSESIFIYGKVDSVKDFMKNHGILLVPIFSGSGVRIKILEALSMGIPVIGTKIAIQGIYSNACLIAEKTDEYIQQIEYINQNDISKIQKEAVDYINNNYNPIELEKKLNAFIEECKA
jgi:glycosyltransferase involved in cell wall biosynthesis